MSIGITDHAVLRFRQRVRPDLNQDEARKFLIKAIEGVEPTTEKPFSTTGDADAWLNIDFGVYLVLGRRKKYSGYSAVTCICNPAMHVRREAA